MFALFLKLKTRADHSSAFRNSLQILLRPGRDAIERLLNVLDRVGDAEAQVAFAESAESGSGQRGDTCVIEQRVGQFLRWPARSRDVGKNIERTVGQTTGKTFDLI
jgi:hypothetical protein